MQQQRRDARQNGLVAGVSEATVGAGRLRASLAVAVALICAGVSGCVAFGQRQGNPLVPAKFLTQAGPYRIWTNEPMAKDADSVLALQGLERQVQRELGLRVDASETPIEVYILDSSDTFEHFLTFYYPELPARRAFFLARGDRRVVYTYFGGRLTEDLRHEATHALLNATATELPLWLDEGLAEYFEVPESSRGLNREHLARLPGDRANGWLPDLERLEALDDVREMTPRDYRESWAWVSFLLDGSPESRGVLLGYLADLKAGGPADSLATRVESLSGAETQARLLAYLDQAELRDDRVATAGLERRSMIYRFQNPVPEVATRVASSERMERLRVLEIQQEPPRTGVFGRFLNLFRRD